MKELIKYHLTNKEKSMPILSFPAVQLMGITVLDLVKNSDLQAEAMKKVAQRYPTSAAVSMMDLSVEAEAFGANIKFSEDEVPTVIGRILENEEDVNKLVVPKVGSARTGIYVEAITKAKKLIEDRPIYAGVIGPYSLSGRLMDMTEIMINCYEEPEMVHKTLAKVSEFILNYIKAYKEAGADGVVMAEPAAGLLSPSICEEFSSAYIKKIVQEVADDDFIFIYHNCGNVIPLSESLIDINADIYHFGNAIDIEEMLKIMPKDKPIMGNINPVLIKDGAPEEIRKVVFSLLDRCGKYENFAISSGCDIPPSANLEGINAYFEAVSDYYRK